MSTSPDTLVVNLLSRWLAGHAAEEELARELRTVDTGEFGPEAEELVEELVDELHSEDGADRGDLERLVRETLEAVALGVSGAGCLGPSGSGPAPPRPPGG